MSILANLLAETQQTKSGMIHLTCRRGKKPANQKYFTQQSCLSKMRQKQTFPDKQKLRKFIIVRSALQKLLQAIFKGETKGCELTT